MRTTIEMKPEHRARLLELAANRGERGLSAVVSEALDLYLNTQTGRVDAVRGALALKGSIRMVRSIRSDGANPKNPEQLAMKIARADVLIASSRRTQEHCDQPVRTALRREESC